MKILLAEDDTNLRDTLSEALRNEGYEVVAVQNGAAAVEVIGNGFTAAVLDGLLPKVTGFEVAKQLRARSPSTAVVLMSGVFKSSQQQSDHLGQTGARAYLIKPFDVRRLLDTLKQNGVVPGVASSSSSSPSPAAAAQPLDAIPPEGNLLEMPALYLAWRIHREGHTGILDLFGATEKARLFMYKGRAVFAQSSDPLHHIGVELLKDGTLTPEQFKTAIELAMQRGVGIYDVLKGEGMATELQMKAAYKGLVPRIIERTPAWTGRFRFTATDAFSSIVPAASSSLLDAMLAGVLKVQEKDLEPHVAPRRPLRLAPGDNWSEVVALLPSACGSDSLTRAINGRATIAQMLEVSPTPQERATRFRQVFVLMSTMAVRASEGVIAIAPAAAQPIAQTIAQPPPTPPPAATMASAATTPKTRPTVDPNADAGVSFNATEQDARARIEAKFKEIEGKNHWEVLGVKRPVDPNTLKKAFYALSRDFHPDAFSGMNLGAAGRKLEHVFSAIQDAYATLSDDAKRGEYEAKTNLEAGGGSSDIAALFAADSDFQKAKHLYERSDLTGCLKVIDRVIQVMPNNEEARGFKAFLDWWQTKNAATAPALIQQLQALAKAAPGQLFLVDFQGWVYLEIGNLKYARATFKKVLELDPKHLTANRGLGAANRKAEEEAKAQQGGGLGKLFGGKR